jgi:hypothetical protein
VSGCDPARPTVPLDNCQRNCTAPFCNDPASVKNRGLVGKLIVHGRASPIEPAASLDPTDKTFTIQLRDTFGGVIFRKTLAAGLVQAAGTRSFKYIAHGAVSDGIKKVKIASVRTLGPLPSYTITVQAYGSLAQATEKMTTSVLIGSQEWSISGIWKRTNSGWKLSVVDTY